MSELVPQGRFDSLFRLLWVTKAGNAKPDMAGVETLRMAPCTW